MYKIIIKKELNEAVTLMEVLAPDISKKAKPGQFIILRVDEHGERIPLTISNTNKESGTVTIIFQVVGLSTRKLNMLKQGDFILDFVGPLGKASEIEGLNKVCIVGGGVGSAICLPLARALYEQGAEVEVILGFRNKDLIILEDEFRKYSNTLHVVTDDGSNDNKGLVTDVLKKILKDTKYDKLFTVGPLIMMKYVVETAKQYDQDTIVSMNPVMIDGTGMCGGCRVSVNGKQKFACVDGPEFDGASINFDEAIARSKMYQETEREKDCNILR